jgi:hypothetical protein
MPRDPIRATNDVAPHSCIATGVVGPRFWQPWSLRDRSPVAQARNGPEEVPPPAVGRSRPSLNAESARNRERKRPSPSLPGIAIGEEFLDPAFDGFAHLVTVPRAAG